MDGQFDMFVVNGSRSGLISYGAGYAIVPTMGVAAVAFFWDPSCRTRSSSITQVASTIAVEAIASNCCHRAEGVSVRVLDEESERRDVYTPERLVGSVRLAHLRVREEALQDGAGSIVAFHGSENGLTIAGVGDCVGLHRVREGRVEQLAGPKVQEAKSDSAAGNGLGVTDDIEIHVSEDRLVHGDILVLSPMPGGKLALYFAHERLDFNRALVRALGDAARTGFFQGIVARWRENPH